MQNVFNHHIICIYNRNIITIKMHCVAKINKKTMIVLVQKLKWQSAESNSSAWLKAVFDLTDSGSN